MTGPERALLQTEAEIARRSAARIVRYLERKDVSGSCAEVARTQLAEYRSTARQIEAMLRSDDEGPLWQFGLFSSPEAVARQQQADADLSEVRSELRHMEHQRSRRVGPVVAVRV